jgi:hypothetical protein
MDVRQGDVMQGSVLSARPERIPDGREITTIPSIVMSCRDTQRTYKDSVIDVCGSTYYDEFMAELSILLKTKKNWDIHKFFYSPYATPNGKSGASLWETTVQMGHHSGYYIPQSEQRLVYDYEPLLQQAFSALSPVGLMLGPGTSFAQMAKEAPTLLAINASKAYAWDHNPKFANDTACFMQQFKGILTQAIIGDFTKPLPSDVTLSDPSRPVFVTMYGGTISQFSLNGEGDSKTTTLSGFFNNLHEVTQGRGFLLATIDSNLLNARDCYSGSRFTAWQEWFWSHVAYMTGDSHFSPNIIKYSPQVDPHTHAVIHSHIVEGATSLRIEGEPEPILLRPVERLEIGQSQKWLPEEIKPTAEKSGWTELKVLNDKSTVKAILYMDKDMPRNWACMVKKALKSAPSHMYG